MNNMIKTAATHAAIALTVQVVLQFLIGWVAAGLVACAVFLGREIAQHEYKGGGPLEVPIHYGLTNHWTTDSVLDVLLPAIATGVAAWIWI